MAQVSKELKQRFHSALLCTARRGLHKLWYHLTQNTLSKPVMARPRSSPEWRLMLSHSVMSCARWQDSRSARMRRSSMIGCAALLWYLWLMNFLAQFGPEVQSTLPRSSRTTLVLLQGLLGGEVAAFESRTIKLLAFSQK